MRTPENARAKRFALRVLYALCCAYTSIRMVLQPGVRVYVLNDTRNWLIEFKLACWNQMHDDDDPKRDEESISGKINDFARIDSLILYYTSTIFALNWSRHGSSLSDKIHKIISFNPSGVAPLQFENYKRHD